MIIGDRLKELRQAKGDTQEAVAAIAGTTKQALSQIESGRTLVPSGNLLEAWSRYFGVHLRWLTTGEGPKYNTGEDPDWDDVLGYAQAAGLGDGPDALEYAETHKLKFRTESLRRKRLRPQALAVMYGKGDSMLPRIRSGDAILFDTSDTRPQDETLFVIMCHGVSGGSYSVKRCREFGDKWFFEALNPEGDHQWRKPRQMDDPRNPCEIIGRVRWIGSWED